ncbi:MAG TPA: hypothetical protein VFV99_18735 [Kofleriaceae bacterium]|nr:hypothetical protein [Kofleriaceae bacterium]
MFSLKALAIVVTGVVAAAGAVGNALWGPRAKARKRLQRGTAAIADREIVTLVGTVRQRGELLVAPLSGKECVLFESLGHVKELRSGSRYADTVAELRQHQMVPFELDTGDEIVVVDGTAADLELPPTPVVPRRIEREKAFLEAGGQPFKLVISSGFDETRVAPGDRIAVQGMAIIELDPTATDERGYRESAPRKIRLVAHDAHPLTIGRARR